MDTASEEFQFFLNNILSVAYPSKQATESPATKLALR